MRHVLSDHLAIVLKRVFLGIFSCSYLIVIFTNPDRLVLNLVSALCFILYKLVACQFSNRCDFVLYVFVDFKNAVLYTGQWHNKVRFFTYYALVYFTSTSLYFFAVLEM